VPRVQFPISVLLLPTRTLMCSLPAVPRARTTIVLLPPLLLEEELLLEDELLEDELLLEEELEEELLEAEPLSKLIVALPLAPFHASAATMQ
jgi:hypothetical protein